ncbi:MAG: hypothetical protein H7145_03170 [Akkermansiaceae bacterium]|nr:hypothetical protein [Armatimonadota bacterium]
MRTIRSQDRFARYIREDRWSNVTLPVLKSLLIVVCFGGAIYWLVTSTTKRTREGARVGVGSMRQVSHVETLLPGATNKKSYYPYASVVKVGGGSVVGRSRTPLYVGQAVYADYSWTRHGLDPSSVRLSPAKR